MRPRSAISTPANSPSSCTSARFSRDRRNFTAFRRCTPKRRALLVRFPFCSARNGSWAVFTMLFWSSARSSRNNVVSGWLDVLGAAADFTSRTGVRRLHVPEIVRDASRRFTSINMAPRRTISPRSPINLRARPAQSTAQMREADLTYEPLRRSRTKTRASRRRLRFPIARRSPTARPRSFSSPANISTSTASINRSFPHCWLWHTTDYLALEKKDAPTFSHRAQSRGESVRDGEPEAARHNGAEVHDCFSITEIVAYEILGLAEPGKGAELARAARPRSRRCAASTSAAKSISRFRSTLAAA